MGDHYGSVLVAMSDYKYPLVEIFWDDAEAGIGWEEAPKDIKPAIAITVGFLVTETKDHVMIASSYDDKNTNGRLQIPKGMIKNMKELKMSKPRKIKTAVTTS